MRVGFDQLPSVLDATPEPFIAVVALIRAFNAFVAERLGYRVCDLAEGHFGRLPATKSTDAILLVAENHLIVWAQEPLTQYVVVRVVEGDIGFERGHEFQF